MRDISHTSFISVLRQGVQIWRKREQWSRETVVQEIIDVHCALGLDKSSGVVFDPQTRDAYERTKVNADRVYRWLDDETKDTNLLPVNFLPSILAALPMDLRIRSVNELLYPAGLHCDVTPTGGEISTPAQMLRSVIKESGEAQSAIADLVDHPDIDRLRIAERELTESIAVNESALAMVEACIAVTAPCIKAAV